MSLRDTKQTAAAVIYMPKRMRETQAAKHEGGAGLADRVMTSRPMSTKRFCSSWANLFHSLPKNKFVFYQVLQPCIYTDI